MSTEPQDELPDVTDEERAAAEALARALEKPTEVEAGSDAAFVLAVRATRGQLPPLSEAARERAVARALDASRRGQRRRVWGPVLLAAVVLLGVVPALSVLTSHGEPVQTMPTLEVADTLFSGPFAEDQRPSERLGRIARARARGYFAARIANEGGTP